MSTLAVSVTNRKLASYALIVEAFATIEDLDGYIKLDFNSLKYEVTDVPAQDLPLNYNPPVVSPSGDQVPLMTIRNVVGENSFGQLFNILAHPGSKSSGTKPLFEKLFLFAVNDGKIDGNAKMCQGPSGVTEIQLAYVELRKLPEWPCDDEVTVTLDYTKTVTVA